MSLFFLLLCYGICFGLQNKLPFLYSSHWRETGEALTIFDRLLHCTYCTGFHCGWLAWLMAWGAGGKLPAEGFTIPLSLLTWAFVSSAFCYALDAAVKWAESNTRAFHKPASSEEGEES